MRRIALLAIAISLLAGLAAAPSAFGIKAGFNLATERLEAAYKVALFERNDLAFGASGNSSGMIHGGPRYLTDDPEVTRTSCLDSGHIQTIAPQSKP